MIHSMIDRNLKSLCLFSTFRPGIKFDENAVVYIKELAKYFELVIVLTNNNLGIQGNISFPANTMIFPVLNKCLDFGMYWNVLNMIKDDYGSYKIEKLGLVNDSCYIVKSLDSTFKWGEAKDFWGITKSPERAEHIQSYFLMFEGRKSIGALFNFVKQNNVYVSENRADIIRNYEIGLSTYMKQNGFALDTLYTMDSLKQVKFGIADRFTNRPNISYFQWDKMVHLGCPLVKRKKSDFPNQIDFLAKYIEPEFDQGQQSSPYRNGSRGVRINIEDRRGDASVRYDKARKFIELLHQKHSAFKKQNV